MADYTTNSSGRGIGLWLAAGVIVLVLIYAIFAGGGASTTTDPASLAVEPATSEAAPTTATDTN